MHLAIRHSSTFLTRRFQTPLSRLAQQNFALTRHLHSSLPLLGNLIPFKLSDIGEGIAEVQLKDWHVKVGDRVEEFDELCAVESDKASVTITSRYSGTIRKLHYAVDDIAKVGQPLLDIEVDGEGCEEGTKNADSSKAGGVAPLEERKVIATPAVRRLLKEHNLRPESLTPTGPNGRLLKEDVLKAVSSTGGLGAVPTPSITSPPPSSTQRTVPEGAEEAETVVPVRSYARAMIKTMTESLKIPHFGYNDDYDMGELTKMREALQPIAREKGIRLSYMPLIIKATSLALSRFPLLNSSLDEAAENLILKKHHNISLAVDTKEGLVVPNIKRCEEKTVWEIAAELNRLLEAGREKGGFSRNDLVNGTFALSNIGSIGGTHMKPVILPPQVCIGAIGRVRQVVGAVQSVGGGTEFVVHSVATFSWAADHRVADGATLARFSNLLKSYIENPTRMAAELR